VIEGGRIKRISIAVLVDGVYGRNEKGESVYEPRAKEEIDRIGALVRTAIGFDQKRGDQVEVVNLRFAEQPAQAISEPSGWLSWLQFTKDDVMRWIELAVLFFTALIVVLFVVRPLVRRIVTPDGGLAGPGAGVIGTGGSSVALPGGGAMTASVTAPDGGTITSAGGPNVALVGSNQQVAISNRTSAMIDIAQVQGQVHAQSIQKVGELANQNPSETVAIVRQWLHEPA
jgi:flagellar M-ring protein FliF